MSAQHYNLSICDLTKPKLLRDYIDHADEIVSAVGQGAVKIEDYEPIGQEIRLTSNGVPSPDSARLRTLDRVLLGLQGPCVQANRSLRD